MSNSIGTCHALVFGIAIISMNYAHADSLNQGVFSIDSNPYGKSYPDWSAKWWQWIMSIPAKDNPRLDSNGQKCSVAQTDPNMWFLANAPSGSVERNCTIPEGKAVFIPLITGECDFLSDPNIQTEIGLRECAFSGIQGATLQATFDGKALVNLENYRARSPVFELVIPPNNSFGGDITGTTRAVADGFYIILEPLSPGLHHVQFRASIVDNPTLGSLSYAIDIKYNIQVR